MTFQTAERKSCDEIPLWAEYRLTEKGVVPILQGICHWAGLYIIRKIIVMPWCVARSEIIILNEMPRIKPEKPKICGCFVDIF